MNGDTGGDRDPILDVRLLGGFEVRVGPRGVAAAVWGQKRAAAVVKLLALEPGHRLHREQVLDVLWPDYDPERAANNLRVALHHARRGLVQAGAKAGRYLTRDLETIVLGPPDRVRVDAELFEEAAARAWQQDDPALSEAAAALYGGELLPDDLYEEWAAARRETFQARYLTVLARLSGLYEQRGELLRAFAARERALEIDPLDEPTNAATIRLHAAMGQPEAALARYETFAARLHNDLGIEPKQATRELALAVREGRIDAVPAIAPAAVSSPMLSVASPLPASVDELLGRERELAELERVLARSRLVSLTGPGGVGKTRLALEAAWRTRDRYRDGVAWVDLSALRDATLVLPTAARALGVDLAASPFRPASLASAIGERRVLLVLDNLEQVVDAGTAIAELLTACPHLTVLGTSRVRLRVRGEREYPVEPLAVPSPPRHGTALQGETALTSSPAVDLFLLRAKAARPDFSITAGNERAVAAICRRLDGLPLALELAAATVRVLSPDELLLRLERPLDLPGPGANDLPERQRTLRDTIAWSYDLLTAEEQGMFRRLGAFVGGWTMEAAARAAGALSRVSASSLADVPSARAPHAPDPLELVSGLVDQSLVVALREPDGETRFRMLETIREFAAERLADHGEADDMQRALEGFLIDLAEEADAGFRGQGQTAWLDRIEAEHDNVRAALGSALGRGDVGTALTLATSIAPFWRARGYAGEGLDWLEPAMAMADDEPGDRRAAALDAIGGLAIDAGEFLLADRAYQQSVELWMALGDRRATVQGLFALAIAKSHGGADGEARAALDEALALARESSDARGVATALHNLGMLDREAGDLERAAARLEQAMTMWRRLGDVHWIGVTASNLGDVHRLRGDVERARVCFDESAQRYEVLGDRFGLGVVANQQGLLHQSEGCFGPAVECHGAALRHFKAVRAPLGIIESLEWLARAAADTIHAAAVLRLFAAAAAARDARGLTPLAADAALVDAGIKLARQRAGDAADAAWSDGLALTLDEARDSALEFASMIGPN